MTDERDPKVTQRYRDLGAEEPPRELDEAILAAARRSEDKPHAPLVTPVGRHRWYFGLAAAAVVVLAVSVTIHVEQQQPDEAYAPSIPLPKPEPAPEAKTPASQAAPAQAPDLASSRAADATMESRARAETAPSAGAAADAAPSATARPAPAPTAKPAPAPPVAAQRAPAARAMERSLDTPEQKLERIAELRREGRHDEADKALDEFRKRYPDYKISGPMLDRVERR